MLGAGKTLASIYEKIIRQLSAANTHPDILVSILSNTCQYFHMATGFIYEVGPTRTLERKEIYHLYDIELPESIPIRDFEEALAQGCPASGVLHLRQAQSQDPLLVLFSARMLVLAPIHDGDSLVGLVGMADRRKDRSIAEKDVNTAETCFLLISNHIKLRINQQRLEQTKRAMTSIMDNMGIDIYVNDYYTHEMMYANQSMSEPYGGWEKMKDKLCFEALYKDKTAECEYCPRPKLLDDDGYPSRVFSWDYQRPFDQHWFRVLSRAFLWVDGRMAHVISSVDITDNKRNEQLVERMALYDTLTGLPNSRKLAKDVEGKWEALLEGYDSRYLLFWDLDGFKLVNDTYGHKAGDQLLQAIAEYMLKNEARFGATYRIAGDEFFMLTPAKTRAQVIAICEEIIARFHAPWELGDLRVTCGLSIGIARYPEEGATLDALLSAADIAMYSAKRQGKGQYRFHEQVAE